jgi:predicted transglutaminase-like cysteine proteinase
MSGPEKLDEGIQTMKKSILSIMATAALLVAASSANAQTQTYTYDGQTVTIDREAILARFCQRYPNARVCGSQIQRVPEIDASSGTQALALVFGVGLLSAEALRRRRRMVPTR